MQVLLPVLVAVIAAFIFVGISVYTSYKHEVETLSTQYSWAFARNVAKDIDNKFARATDTIDSLANAAITLSATGEADRIYGDEELIYKYLENMAKANSGILAFYIIWDEAKYAPEVFQTGGKITRMAKPDTAFTSDYYTTPLSSGRHYITPVPREADYDGDKYTVMTLSRPFEVNGKTVGIVGVDIAIDDIMQQVAGVQVYDTGYAALFSPTQTYLAHKNPDAIGQKDEFTQEEITKFNKNEEFIKVELSKVSGKLVDVFFVPIPLSRTATFYYIGLMVPIDEMLADVNSARTMIIAIAFAAALVVSIVVLLVVRSLMRMVGGEPKLVISSVNKIADGDFSVAVKHDPKDNYSLVFYINSMVAKLRQIIADSMQVADDLSEASETLSAGAQELSAGMASQAEQTEQISSAATEMSATTESIAQSVDEVVEVTSDVEAKVASSVTVVENSLNEINKVKTTADAASELIKGLQEKSSEISSIIETITAIADQTNLLALNAAIEAARAGDAGRGFAVVADEVRKLAEKTQSSTGEISSLVSSVESEISRVTESMQGVNKQVDVGVQASQSITSALREIDEVALKLRDMMHNISGATHEMSATSDQIQGDIAGIAAVSEQVHVTTDHLAENATVLDRISHQLREMMHHFKLGNLEDSQEESEHSKELKKIKKKIKS
jgi:methyl-accepting chemotaxis protein